MTSDRNGKDRTTVDVDAVGSLIRTAGRRPAPPDAAYRRALEVATDALEAKLATRRKRRRLAALAATVAMVALVAGSYFGRNSPPAAVVARMERAIGAVQWSAAPGADWRMVAGDDMPLPAGSRLRVQPGSKAGLLLNDGTSLRMAGGTEIELESATRVVLARGAVYADSGFAGAAARGIEIATPAGIVRDVGTQFEVALRDGACRLRVREGHVRISRGALEAHAGPGDEITVHGNGPPAYRYVTVDDPDWRWVEDLAPAPDIDGKTVDVVLDWVARETGRAIRYEDALVEQQVRRTILHGTIRRMKPLDALSVMLATTDFSYELLADGTIRIAGRSGDEP